MDATALFKAGQLAEAIAAQTAAVKANPADQNSRLFLFELLAFAGEIDRARKQLDVLNYDEPELLAAVVSYRQILDAEAARRELFASGKAPQYLGEVPHHVTLRLQALDALRAIDIKKAAEWLDHAASITPTYKGTLNGTSFSGLRDCDDLLGPVLEVFAVGKYYWVPFEEIESIRMNAPRFPRDLLYVPAKLETPGSSGDVFLPALYPNTYRNPDDKLKLGRLTDWVQPPDGPTLGVGAKVFLAGEAESSLLEWRELTLEPTDPTGDWEAV